MSANHSAAESNSQPPSLPLVVQVGFAGARRLWPEGASVDGEAFERAVASQLLDVLRQLPSALGLSPQHFVVGVSQVAAGADLLFTEAAAQLGWGQRVFLPQLLDDYLAARGSQGPDFTPAEQARARALLASPHLIEQRVVTTAAGRVARFDDTNLSILGEADVLVCLRREGQVGLPGGTQQLMERARARGVRVLELCVSVTPEGLPAVTHAWDATPFTPPALPSSVQSGPQLGVDGATWPDVRAYALALKARASERAGRRRSGFERATVIIIGTHVVATLFATLVMKIIEMKMAVKVVLIAEMALLVWGVFRHRQLHHDNHTGDWAQARLCAELARSVLALGRLPASLAHLLALPVPVELGPVLRTLNVLQLRQLRQHPEADWASERERYVSERLSSVAQGQTPGQGQLGYYGREQAKAKRMVTVAGWAFTALSVLAITATFTKLVLKCFEIKGWPIDLTGLFAVVLPVAAVGAMSVAAALDAEARAHTFHQMREFLHAGKLRLQNAASPREAAALAAETEARLFGETVLWYARRAYTSVA